MRETAQRRMFSKDVIDSDEFADLPTDSKLLYFIVGMNSDDEGICKSCKMLMKIHGIKTEYLEELINAKFVIQINKIVVVRHWLLNNQIRRDRFHPSSCPERELISVEADTKIYYTDNEIQSIDSYFTPLSEYRQRDNSEFSEI